MSAFGQVVWLMNRSRLHRHLPLSDLDWRVRAPLALKQYRVFRVRGRAVAFVSWAFASDEVARRLQTSSPQLQPSDWRSGQRPVVVDMVAPFGGADACLKETLQNVFGGASGQVALSLQAKTATGSQTQASPAPAVPAGAVLRPGTPPSPPVAAGGEAAVAEDSNWRRTVADAAQRGGNGELHRGLFPQHATTKLQ